MGEGIDEAAEERRAAENDVESLIYQAVEGAKDLFPSSQEVRSFLDECIEEALS